MSPRDGTPPAEHETGCRLRRGCRGRGLATEGSRALIDHAFGFPTALRVTANAVAAHVASRIVMEKCGMTLVRNFHAEWPVRIDGDEAGDVEYAITRAEWLAGRPGPNPPADPRGPTSAIVHRRKPELLGLPDTRPAFPGPAEGPAGLGNV
ncbi:GNAT family N-acetyltransferase [Paeniglutamicibacter sp. NPDC012692]|uniref:GNAT family N-acetyltransferase n=1 Tax=Paeniglutamicibacter sp. NPDC012692 TaxID=3364388 RepID=UPI003679E62A